MLNSHRTLLPRPGMIERREGMGLADGPNWTLARLAGEIKAQEGVSISRSQLSKLLHKKTSAGDSRGTA